MNALYYEASSPLVTVVMPAYNSEHYIAQSIRSVQEQSFQNWELIVCDGRSTDRTQAIVRELNKDDPRIRLLVNEGSNTTASGNRRCAIDAAAGQWIALLDSDDLWDPTKLEKQLRKAEETGGSFLFTGSAFIKGDNTNRLSYVLSVPEKIGFPEILEQNIISCSSVLIQKTLLDGCFLEDSFALREDFSAWIRILKNKVPCAFGINEPLLTYRLTSGSVSSNKLHSAISVFRTYRSCGVSVPTSIFYWLCYAWLSLVKYTKIYKNLIKGENR